MEHYKHRRLAGRQAFPTPPPPALNDFEKQGVTVLTYTLATLYDFYY